MSKTLGGMGHDVAASGIDHAAGKKSGKSFGEVFAEKKEKLDNLQKDLAAAIMPSIPGMPAGKFYDIGIGIDFHSTTFPPSPLSPVPNVSMVFDLFTMLFVAINSVMPPPPPPAPPAEGEEPEPQPITVSSVARAIVTMMQPSVQVNNQWIANAGCSIQHLPGVFVHLPFPVVAPMAEGEMFMGSSTVMADGAPFSYQFLPALSCNLVGVPAPFRAKKLGKPKMSLMAPTVALVTVLPKGKPVLVGGPPTIDLFAMAMQLGLKGLGKLWKLGRKAMPAPKSKWTKNAKCFLFGEPVDAVTGRVYSENEDFALNGPIPLQWNRIYFSDNDTPSPLGRGWHHSYDLYHTQPNSEGHIEVKIPDGRLVPMPPLMPLEEYYHPIEKLFWHHNGQHYILTDEQGLQYHYQSVDQPRKTYKVTAITNAVGDTIALQYNHGQQLTSIRDSVGRILKLTYHFNRNLLEKIELLNEDYRPIWQHRYAYNDEQLLAQVIDVRNATKTFEYKDGLLVHLTNQLGQHFHWEYQGKGNNAKCVHTWGDEGILEYHTKYEKGKTIVTNSLGHTTTYHYNEDNLVTKIVDPLGNSTIHEYDHNQDKVQTIDPMGNTTKFGYNERGMLIKETNAFGNSQTFEYDDRNRLLSSRGYGGATFKRVLNEAGQATEIHYPSGTKLQLTYKDGKLHQLIDQDGQMTTLVWDNKHNLSQITAPNGSISYMDHDFFGQLISAKAPNGATTSYVYDQVGNVLELIEPTGCKHQFTYDTAGNVLSANDGKRHVAFTYWGLGNLKTRKENGRLVRFAYDTEEQLKSIVNEKGEAYRFTRNGNGEIIGEWGFDGLSRQYARNANGQVTAVSTPSQGTTQYKYNAVGQVIAIEYPDKSYELYNYDKAGALIEATNLNGQVLLKRNAQGQVIEELQNGHRIQNTYNSFGQRTQLQSSLGADIQHVYNVLGQLTQTTAQQSEVQPWEAHYSYNSMGLEIERTLNGVTQRTERDLAGRATQQLVHAKNVEHSRRSYQWNPNNQLQQLTINGTRTLFDYDAYGNLASAGYNNGTESIYKTPDAVGNLYDNRDRKGYTYNKGGKLIEDPDCTYEYNDLGFLTKKTHKHQAPKRFSLLGDDSSLKLTWQYHWYANGSLQQVTNNEGLNQSYEYDALGRRTAKINGAKQHIHRYIYDGNVLLHEFDYKLKDKPKLVSNELGHLGFDRDEDVSNLTTWVFDEGTFVPTAKITKDEKYSIISDHLGTPVEAYSEDGNKVWERELDIYGKVRKGDSKFCPFLYQGQYFDEETGLAYNRFRYYSPDTGTYISQDPIGYLGNNANFYAYVPDSNSWIDVFGLDCSSDAAKLRKAMQKDGVVEPNYKNSAHHIVMSNSKDPKMVELRQKMNQLGIDKNDAVNGAYLPTSSKVKAAADTSAHAHSKVHTKVYKQNVYDRLKDINNKADFEDALMDIGDELGSGTFGI